jgi:hypothetical protein
MKTHLKKILLFTTACLILILPLFMADTQTQASASCSSQGVSAGDCINNRICTAVPPLGNLEPGAPCGSSVVGRVIPPRGVLGYNLTAGGLRSIGMLIFASRIIRLMTIVAGIWVMANFIIAGYQYIVGFGDTNAHKAVKERLTWSVVGLATIVAAYAAAGIIGLIFFGDAGFILNPELYSAVDTP